MFGLGVLLILIGALILLAAVSCEIKEKHPTSIIGFIGGLFFLGGIILCKVESIPSALNVYQGRTTLKVTYEDSVAVDSTVVFKNMYMTREGGLK
jgi:hypothetical protein